MDTNNLQKQIDELKRRLDALNNSTTIPLTIDLAWQNRGFVKTSSPGIPANDPDFINNEGFRVANTGTGQMAALPVDYLTVLNPGFPNCYIALYHFNE